ncbi:MAG: class I SAM-dependent methyltransferase [Sphingobacteriales bacterium]|nr:MAG: class I SAM-dependent methyltransferase [Sphingobacteriales bacterium]
MIAETNEYTGTDNLEVMQEAVNYNAYLLNLVVRFARSTKNLIDFGAGIGTFAKVVEERGFQVHCIEPDSKQAERIKLAGFQVDLDITDLETESCDFMYSFNVFEHIENDQYVMRECFRVLKPGGKILIYVPAFSILYSSMDKKVGHIRRYRRDELKSKIEQAGFIVETSEYVDSLGFVASLLFKWIGNDSGTLNRGSLIFYDRVVFPISRALDYIFKYTLGKNTFVVARK